MLFLYDATVLGSGKLGFVLTNKKIYTNKENKNIYLNEITDTGVEGDNIIF
ncbi:hypothetical protein CPJCM30710_32980 [Clostridium polyendosporum]|uniref:Uncharacterized protein n=1 Tax=Clostridium polyendosporum TaxID=69208 RepID=A0A919VHV3_9CLOT|nr:hypothetical protein [Clostridium polyendosporum]GIM30632.1 hypothetical protein CPJCM30710_32980 [Clostridium polyendosporum]